MRYMALACDYDGTLATDGKVDAPTLGALERIKASGRRLLLVTGRQLDDLQQVFGHLDLFDLVVGENGALLFTPATRQSRLLSPGPPPEFTAELARRNVPFTTGRSIVATWKPHDVELLDAIRDLGLELQVIFNKESVMVLPSGVNKATGLLSGLEDLGLSCHNVVAVGDAENDHALLRTAECGVAVANSVPMLKEHADMVTDADHGAGVAELIEHILQNDLSDIDSQKLARHHLPLGRGEDGSDVTLSPYGPTILLAGPSGGGKSSLTTAFLEQICGHGYQFCLFDPEGDYEGFTAGVSLGTPELKPDVQAVMALLERPSQNAIVNFTGVTRDDRPKLFEQLLPQLLQLRVRTGRPHWIIVDEVHHMLPAGRRSAEAALPREPHSILMITLEPERVAAPVLALTNTLLAVGDSAGKTIQSFLDLVGEKGHKIPSISLPRGEAALWRRHTGRLSLFKVTQPESEHRRHRRKYAEGQLEPEEHFRFRGPEDKLNLRAPNLAQFLELAEGVDDDTWLFHLKQGDYSRWFRKVIKDKILAERAEAVEREKDPSARQTREQIRAAIAERYTV